MTARNFDAIVIGAGQAGPPLAGRLAQTGMSVALIERKLVGGTCVNTGCMPTKAMIASAHVAQLARRASEYGMSFAGPLHVDMQKVKARKDKISRDARTGLEQWLQGLPKCTLLRGHARFVSSHEVRVGDERLVSERIFLNTGARAHVPAMPGLDRVSYLTNTSVLELADLPRHLVIVGGSYVGLEFAQMFRRFGSAVTVIQRGPRLLQREDPDVSDAVRAILEHEGIAVHLGAECTHFEPRDGQIYAGLRADSGADKNADSVGVLGSHLLLAVGRRPNTDDLDLERAGVELDARGYVVVDESLQTTAPGIWALGDCNGKGAFTHTSYDDYEIVAENLLEGRSRRVSHRIVAYAVYTDPPLGRVGMTETQARKEGLHVQVGTRPMTRVGRAVEKGETQGFMKIMVDAKSQQILGASILGTGGDEAIHAIVDTMYAKAPYTTLRDAVHIHPTVSELLPTVLSELT